MKKAINGYEFRTKLAELCLDYSIEKDLDGQLVIYTGLREIEGDRYTAWEGEGECDHCETRFDIGSQIDHCADCGNCWTHCVEKVGA